jgi:hypothetical protein
MPQRASVFCNFYIRVDREALVSERALNVGSVAFKAMSTKNPFQKPYPRYYSYFTIRLMAKTMFNLELRGQGTATGT